VLTSHICAEDNFHPCPVTGGKVNNIMTRVPCTEENKSCGCNVMQDMNWSMATGSYMHNDCTVGFEKRPTRLKMSLPKLESPSRRYVMIEIQCVPRKDIGCILDDVQCQFSFEKRPPLVVVSVGFGIRGGEDVGVP
jgi:hypothetical protein